MITMNYPHPMDDKTGFEATDEEMGLTHNPETGLDCVSAGAVRLDPPPAANRSAERKDLAGDRTAGQVNRPWTVEVYREHTNVEGPIWTVAADVNNDDAPVIAAAHEMLDALRSLTGYLLNAKIDIETGTPKATTIQTIEGGLKLARAAIAKAEGRDR